MKGTKVQKHKSVKMAWERGTNEYCYLPSAAILWGTRCQLPEDKSNNETHFLASTELSGLEGLGFPFFPSGLSSMIKVHTSVGWEIHLAGRIHQMHSG